MFYKRFLRFLRSHLAGSSFLQTPKICLILSISGYCLYITYIQNKARSEALCSFM